jgi:hypothetical protein
MSKFMANQLELNLLNQNAQAATEGYFPWSISSVIPISANMWSALETYFITNKAYRMSQPMDLL